MSNIIELPAGTFIPEAPGSTACCCLMCVVGLVAIGDSCNSRHKKPAIPPSQQKTLDKQEYLIDPDKLESNTPETNLQLENIIDPDAKKVSSFLLEQIRNYQENISPRIKERMGRDRLCKFKPSCSEYAKQAIIKYGSARGTAKATGRLVRCNPWSKGGYDPLT